MSELLIILTTFYILVVIPLSILAVYFCHMCIKPMPVKLFNQFILAMLGLDAFMYLVGIAQLML